jgi:hypothetical protein
LFDAAAALGQEIGAAYRTALLQDLKSVRAIVPDNKGGFVVVSGIKPAPGGPGASVLQVDSEFRVSRTAPIPAPANLPADTTVVEVFPEAAISLASGDIVVVGYVETKVGRMRGFAGWAAKISRDGAVFWNRTWSVPGAPQAQEFFYFVRMLGDAELLVGGKVQHGDGCQQDSSGVLLRIKTSDGTAVGSRIHVTHGAKRQGLRDAHVHADGKATLVGWVSDGSPPGQPCLDDVWLARFDLPGSRRLESRRAKLGGSALGFALTSLGDELAVIGSYAGQQPPSSSGLLMRLLPQTASLSDFEILRHANDPRSRLLFATAGPGGSQVAAGFGTQSERLHAWARLSTRHGTCAADIVFEAGVPGYDDTRALTASVSSKGALLVGGEARIAGTQQSATGWLGWVPAYAVVDRQRGFDVGALTTGASPRFLIARPVGSAMSAIAARFSLPGRQHVQIVVRQIENVGGIDLVARKIDGGLVGTLGHYGGGAAVLELTLERGSYEVQAVIARPQIPISISLSSPPVPTDIDASVVQLNERPALERRLIRDELRLLGFDAGADPSIGAGEQIVKAIQAFQASYCRPITGRLDEMEQHRLAVAAARRDVADAIEALAELRRSERDGKSVQGTDTAPSRPARLAEPATPQVGRIDVDGGSHEGRVKELPGRVVAEGPGRFSGTQFEAVGRFFNGFLRDRGRIRMGNGDVLLGRLVTLVDPSNRVVGYSLSAGVSVPSTLELMHQPRLGAAYEGCRRPGWFDQEGPRLLCAKQAPASPLPGRLVGPSPDDEPVDDGPIEEKDAPLDDPEDEPPQETKAPKPAGTGKAGPPSTRPSKAGNAPDWKDSIFGK